MTNISKNCKLCTKRILTHEKIIYCSTCKHPWHHNCLPNYSATDIGYASDVANSWTCPLCLKDFFPFYEIENSVSFTQTVINPTSLFIEIEALENMIYDPFDSTDPDDEGILSNIDPDQNFLGEIRGKAIASCKYYYTATQMDKLLDTNSNSMTSILLHLNIRSIPKNLDTFIATLHSSNI
jgi:hypothetical protein